MTEELRLAAEYRERAAELRATAGEEAMSNRETLLGMAADYERMAKTMEAIDKTNKNIRKSF